MVGKFLRHLLAIAILPFSVTVLIPLWIARRYSIGISLGAGGLLIALQFVGLVVLMVGLVLFLSSLRRFATVGQGTLAPWDPPKHLVVRGPYRFVRNPMISGVIFILVAEAMILMSTPHTVWALIFLGMNLVYIPLFEEPFLRVRFGESYHEYCQNVPRIFPRLRPWAPNHEENTSGLRGQIDKQI
jgi:protein-S-isoprenylcysteine O-methyltransferase Ste14